MPGAVPVRPAEQTGPTDQNGPTDRNGTAVPVGLVSPGAPIGPAEAVLIDPVAAAGARRMRRIILIVLLVLSLAAVALGITWQKTGLWNPSWGARDGVVCPVQMVQPADADQVKVNVYNGSIHEGIGATTARTLRDRGFQEGAVANAKLEDRVSTAEGFIVAGQDSAAEALAVQRQLPRAKIVIQAGRSESSIDLILGDGFHGLTSKKRVSHAPGRLDCSRQVFSG